MVRSHATAVLLVLCAPASLTAGSAGIALRYDAALVKNDFASPAARVTFNGRTAWFLVDTGAGVHMLCSWFVAAAGLQEDNSLADAISGVDSTGQRVRFRGLKKQAGRVEDGRPLTLDLATVADFPPEFEQLDIGGVLSPQLLAGPGEAAVLDLRVPELVFEPFAGAVRRLGARKLPRDRVRFCGSIDGPIANLVFAIPVAVRNHEGALVLDSGAKVTKLVSSSRLVRGVALDGQKRGTTGISGKEQSYSLARGLDVKFAGYTATVDARVAEATAGACGSEGLLGLDALGRCALVLGRKDVAIKCGN